MDNSDLLKRIEKENIGFEHSPIVPSLYDYKSYKKYIDDLYKKNLEGFSKFKGFKVNEPLKIFWRICDGKPVKHSLYYDVALSIAYKVRTHILVSEKKLDPKFAKLEKEWFEILDKNFFFPYALNFDKYFYKDLLHYHLYDKRLLSLALEMDGLGYDELDKLAEKGNIIKYFTKFKTIFAYYYAMFEKTSLYITSIIHKIQVSDYNFRQLFSRKPLKVPKGPPRKLSDVYSGPRTPRSEFWNISNLLNNLRHIKNSIQSHTESHYDNLINPEEAKEVIIEDINPYTRETRFKESFNISKLHFYYKCLLFLIKGFKQVALFYSVISPLLKIYAPKLPRLIECPICGFPMIFLIKTTLRRFPIICIRCLNQFDYYHPILPIFNR
ncbi:MAG: hypothetical protein HWN67_04025 [Candidatus Helarchaeota archaeon]|nr:hypothetical protein [Candidatus Helarchaeota archaeon]